MTSAGNCACNNQNQHVVCDDSYLYAPLYSPSETQLAAESAQEKHPAAQKEAIVSQIRPRASETFVCPCGSQWFSMHYRMSTSGKIIERSGIATCDGGCGRKYEVTTK